MKIIKLKAENVKRLQAVEITPDGNLVIIGGRNAQGKSSVLDAIEAAIGGKDHSPAVPIRRGEKRASVILELGDLTVTKTFNEAGNSYLTVATKDGAKYPSPQTVLDKLVGTLSFDPLEFSRMDPKRQLKALKDLVGLDFSQLDENRKELFDERTAVNRQVKELQGALVNMPLHGEVPEAEISVQDLLVKLEELEKKNRENAQKRTELEKKRVELRGLHDAHRDLLGTIADLREQLALAEEKEASLHNQIDKATGAGKAFAEEVAALQDEDVAGVKEQIRNADTVNSKIRENAERRKVENRYKDATFKANNLTEDIEKIDRQKSQALAEAKFPVPGMSFDENGVLLNGLPFEQGSSAEQLRASVAMGLALNPKLKVLLVRDGSLLDAEGLQLISEMAAQADAQIWIERVSEGDEVSVVIEDGLVKEQLQEAANQ